MNNISILFAGFCFSLLAGCPQAPLEIPSMLRPVLEDESAFRPREDSAVLGIRPGTPIDSLELGLPSCWGSALDDGGAAVIALLSSFRFNVDGSYEAWELQRDALGLGTVLVGESGAYTIVNSGQVLLTRDRLYSQIPGEALIEDQDAAPLQLSAFVTVNGDEMLLLRGFDDPDAAAPNDRAYSLYRRYDCP